jgi:hypothetical protein
MRRHFTGPEDLPQVQDADLLRACREIGLLSDVGYTQVDHVRYMRNHASAAHPNQVDLTGLQLASWLETCIRQVITLPQDPITAHTGRLLRNIKASRLSAADTEATASFFEELPPDRADTLAAGLFGLYTDTRRTAVATDNVRLLWPELWDFVSEEARYAFGTRYGRFQASAEMGQAATSSRKPRNWRRLYPATPSPDQAESGGVAITSRMSSDTHGEQRGRPPPCSRG